MIIKAVSVIFFLSPVIFAGTYTNDQAVSLVNAAGIHISSSGGCSDQNNPSCTSLNGIHSECIDGPHGIIAFKSASSCDPITITGGTEVGHASGTYSHGNGWKLDIRMTDCMTTYIQRNFHQNDDTHWQDIAGYIYYYEGNHWDITFHSPNHYLYPCTSSSDCNNELHTCVMDIPDDSSSWFCNCYLSNGPCTQNKDCCNNKCQNNKCAQGGGGQGTVCKNHDANYGCQAGCTCIPFDDYGYCQC